MSYNPTKWGPESLTSKDYEFMMADTNCAAPKISLLEHAVTSPSQELSDPVQIPVTKKVRGKIVTVNKTIKPAQQTALTYTILFPSSLWTPALNKARQPGGCLTDFFAKYLCASDAKYNHAYIYPDGLLDPPSEVEDFITNTTDETILTEQTTLHTSERLTLYNLIWTRQVDLTDPGYAIVFKSEDCIGCSDDIFVDLVASTADGTAAPDFVLTGNRYATNSEVVAPSPATSRVVDLWSQGAVVLAANTDGVALATGVTGGTSISFDDGATWSLDSNITAPIRGVTKFGNLYLAVGGTGAGIGLLYSSLDGITWTSITSSVLSGTTALAGIAVDEAANKFYVCGEAGMLLAGTFSGSSIILSSLTANLPSPTALNVVAVLGQDHIMVGGASGYCAESFDAGVTWSQPGVPGSAAITTIAGNCYRTLIGAATAIYERSILTADEFRAVVLDGGVTLTGNVQKIAQAPGSDINYFAVITDAGEIVFAKPPYPNA